MLFCRFKRYKQVVLFLAAFIATTVGLALLNRGEDVFYTPVVNHKLYDSMPPMVPMDEDCSIGDSPTRICEFLREHRRTGGRIASSSLLTAVCQKEAQGLCFVPFSMKHEKPLVPLPLSALHDRLAHVGGAECVSGPLRSEELVKRRVLGIHGEPLWAVYRKSCEGRYRDLTRLEIISVLHHYTSLVSRGGRKVQRGIFLHGDSMIQNFGEVFWSVLRGQEHNIQSRQLNLFVMHRDYDEVYDIPEEFGCEKVIVRLPIRCNLETFHPGSLLDPPNASSCEKHVQDTILTLLVKRDRYLEHPCYGFLRRVARPAVSYHSFNYWWDQDVPSTQSVESLMQSYLEFEEAQYDLHFREPIVNPSHSRNSTKIPPLLFLYGTSPMRENAASAAWRIDDPLVMRRNTFLRTLRWQHHPADQAYSLFAGHPGQTSATPLRRYLIDFAVLKEFLGDAVHTTDRTHFACSVENYMVQDGHFCVDSMNYVQMQWVSHIVASELLFATLPKTKSLP